jgi:hypothetical protein
MFKSKSLLAVIICCIFLTSVSFYVSKWNAWGSQAEISWDISGYYMYLPGLFYDKLGQLNKLPEIIDKYHPCNDEFYAYHSPIGKYVIKYSSGMAVMYLPGFMVGHIWAKLGGYPVDGFSYPYQVSMALYSLLISFIGLWIIRKILLLYFEDAVVACSILILCFASNYLQYSAITPMFSHNYLFTIYAALVYISIAWYKNPDYKKAVGLGVLAGLAALTRPTEVICALIPLTWGIDGFAAFKPRFQLLFKQWPKILAFAFCAVCIGFIQLLYWKRMTGHFIYWSYQADEGFNFLRVPVHDCLFSYKKGWFVYTPVMAIWVLGFIPLLLRRRNLFWPVLLFNLLAFYIVFSWKCWWYGGSFSQRALVQYYALLIFALAAFLEWVKVNRYTLLATFIFCLACTYLNLVMTFQANISGVMESDNMSKDYYWAILGKPYVSNERKKLIYTNEDLPLTLKSTLSTIYRGDTLALNSGFKDTTFIGKKLFILNKEQHAVPEAAVFVTNLKSGWFRIHSLVSMRAWDYSGDQPYIYASFFNKDGVQIKFKSYFVNRVIDNDSLTDIFLDTRLPDQHQAYLLKAGLTNNHGGKQILAGPIWIEYTPQN